MSLKRKFKIKNKVLITWILSYVLVLTVPLAIGSLIYSEARKIISEEIGQVHRSSLEQVKSTLDSDLGNIAKISQALSVDSNVTKIMYKRGSLSPKEFMGMYSLQKSMRSLTATNDMIEGIYVYFPRNGSILTNLMRIDSMKYGHEIMNDFRMSAIDWIDMITAPENEKYNIIGFEDLTGSLVKKVVYTDPVQSFTLKSASAYVVMLIDGDYLERVLSNAIPNSESILTLTDAEGDTLSTSGNIFGPELKPNDHITMHSESDESGWRFTAAVPTDIYMAKLEYIRLIMYIYIAAGLLFGISIAIYMIYQNYKPLRKLIQLAGRDAEADSREDTNEYKFIEQIMENLFKEKNSLNDRLESQRKSLRENFLGRLMKGSIIEPAFVDESCRMHGIDFKGGRFSVMILQIESLSDVFSADDPKDIGLIDFILKMTAEEIASEKHYGAAAEVDGRICCVIELLSEGSGDFGPEINELSEIAERSVKFLESNFSISVTAATGSIHEGFSGISQAYSEAIEVVEYRSITEDIEPVLKYDSLFCFSVPGEEESVMFKERKFSELIIKKDFDGAYEVIDDIIENNILKSTPSLQAVKYRVFGLINIMVNAIGEIRNNMRSDVYDDAGVLEKLTESNSIKEIKELTGTIFASLGKYYSENNEPDPAEKYDEILEYIQMNFTDPDLSVSSISYVFGINISYVSRMFKKEQGIGMLDHIHKLRVERAKQLMAESDMSITKIAQKVGYANDIAIIRAFKRYEGITPGRFRDREE